MQQEQSDMGAAAKDLRWYFTRTDAGPLKSNYGAMVYRIAMGRSRRDGPVGAGDDEHLFAASRAGGVARVLRALDPQTVELLWRAFGVEQEDALLVLSGLGALAPFTEAAAKAHRRSKSPLPLLEWLATFVDRPRRAAAHLETLDRVEREARLLLGRALASYLTTRRRIGIHE